MKSAQRQVLEVAVFPQEAFICFQLAQLPLKTAACFQDFGEESSAGDLQLTPIQP